MPDQHTACAATQVMLVNVESTKLCKSRISSGLNHGTSWLITPYYLVIQTFGKMFQIALATDDKIFFIFAAKCLNTLMVARVWVICLA